MFIIVSSQHASLRGGTFHCITIFKRHHYRYVIVRSTVQLDPYSSQLCTETELTVLIILIFYTSSYQSILSTRSYWTDLLEVHWYVEWEKYGVDDWQLLSWSVTTRGRLDVLTRRHRLQLPLLFARKCFSRQWLHLSISQKIFYIPKSIRIDDTNLYYLVHNLNQHLGY